MRATRRGLQPLRRLAVLGALLLALAACNGDDGEAAPALTPTPTPEPDLDDPADGALPTPTPTAADDDATDEQEETDGPPPAPLPSDSWTLLDEAPVALTEVAGAAFLGDLWIAGGFTADGAATSAVRAYDPTFGTWQDMPALPGGVHHAALVGTDDGLLLLGGYVGSGFDQPTDAVLRFDPATGDWEPTDPLPAARAAGAAAYDGNRVVYGGGVGPEGLAGDVFMLEAGGWRAGGELSEAREHLAAASDGAGRVWFLAGRTGGLDTNLTAVDLVVDGGAPQRIGDLPTARGGLTGFYADGVGACAVGGEDPDRTYAEVECIDGEGEVSTLPALGQPRHGLGADVIEGVAYAVLGGPEPGLAVSATVEALGLD